MPETNHYELISKQIFISNEKKFKILKEKIIANGAERLHILADFDKTLTPAFIDGQPFQSIISILRDGNYLSPDYAGKARALFEKYHALEHDRAVPVAERKKRCANGGQRILNY